MSIINDAIKKARKEFELKRKGVALAVPGKEKPAKAPSGPSEVKWTVVIVISLVLIVSLFGSLLLYTHMSKLNARYKSAVRPRVKKGFPVAVKKVPSKTEYRQEAKRFRYPGAKIEDILELNGIVYGSEDKWAIINNKITREGDVILNGELIFIEKHFVKIKNNDGEEIILELR